MPATRQYLTPTEATSEIEALLAPTDPRRVAWEAGDTDDHNRALIGAANEFDALTYEGFRYDPDQALAWPRYRHSRRLDPAVITTSDLIDPDPDDASDQSVPNLPKRFKQAVALQAAHILSREHGVDIAGWADEAAHRGIGSQSGAGGGHSIDLRRAENPRARLHVQAWHLIARYSANGKAKALKAI